MAHIADLANNGRCGVHQHIDQARGAYAQLIGKEISASNNASLRQEMLTRRIHCPACGVKVCTPKCHMCNYYPIGIAAPAPSSTGSECSYATTTASQKQERRRRTEDRLVQLEEMITAERDQQKQIVSQIASVRKLVEAEAAKSTKKKTVKIQSR
jgi:hypothetical protein